MQLMSKRDAVVLQSKAATRCSSKFFGGDGEMSLRWFNYAGRIVSGAFLHTMHKTLLNFLAGVS